MKYNNQSEFHYLRILMTVDSDHRRNIIPYHFVTIVLSDIEYAKNYAKMAESAKTLASQQVTEEPFHIFN